MSCHWCSLLSFCITLAGCNCNRDGSLDSSCDVLTGQCSCKSNITGLSCDQCLDGHWGLQELNCASCQCNTVGAVNNSCDQITGQCICRKGITGRTCDKCRPNYYGFSITGCTGGRFWRLVEVMQILCTFFSSGTYLAPNPCFWRFCIQK